MVRVTPSVGRVVHYTSYGTPGGEYTSECRAAIITDVSPVDDTCVSLCVVNPTGLFFNTGVLEDDRPQPRGGTWHWAERVS